VARMGEGRGVHRVLVGKPEGKRPLGSVEFSTFYNNQQYSAICNAAASLAFKEGNTAVWRSHTGAEASRLLIRVNVKLFRCIIKRHTTKAFFRVNVQLHAFLQPA
jgi:hypothetical protein